MVCGMCCDVRGVAWRGVAWRGHRLRHESRCALVAVHAAALWGGWGEEVGGGDGGGQGGVGIKKKIGVVGVVRKVVRGR